jgi:aminoglycoside 3-N-acetyltransferase
VTAADVRSALEAVGVGEQGEGGHGEIVIVHSSLSRLGWVVGGAQSVVVGLLAAAGDGGTIVMPAQTGISDPSTWQNPPVPEAWWPTIRASWPAFDPNLTPLRAMGAVVECFRRLPEVRYSGHPSTGFIGRGPQAATLLAEHPLEDSFGERSPLGRLYEADARIVLIGIDHGNNTSLHLAEHRAAYPGKPTKTDGAPLIVDGERRWVSYTDLDHDADDFADLGRAFVAAGGIEHRAPLGLGEVAACRMREIVEFGTSWIGETRSTARSGSSGGARDGGALEAEAGDDLGGEQVE